MFSDHRTWRTLANAKCQKASLWQQCLKSTSLATGSSADAADRVEGDHMHFHCAKWTGSVVHD